MGNKWEIIGYQSRARGCQPTVALCAHGRCAHFGRVRNSGGLGKTWWEFSTLHREAIYRDYLEISAGVSYWALRNMGVRKLCNTRRCFFSYVKNQEMSTCDHENWWCWACFVGMGFLCFRRINFWKFPEENGD